MFGGSRLQQCCHEQKNYFNQNKRGKYLSIYLFIFKAWKIFHKNMEFSPKNKINYSQKLK